jgi:NitT/TauT family transport system substrate-binding protein
MSSQVISRPHRHGRPGARLARPAWALAVAGALTVSLAACGSSAGSASGSVTTQTLSIALGDTEINPVTDSALRLASTLGFYAKNHLKVNIIGLNATPAEVAALKSGHADLADIDVDSAIELQEKKLVNIRAVSASDLGPPYVIASTTDVKTVAQLKGKKFAISSPGGLDDEETAALLKADKVDDSALDYVQIGSPSERVQALAHGRVDATAVSAGSYQPIAGTPGLHVLVNPRTFYDKVPIQSKFTVALTSTIKTKADAIQRFVTAQLETARYLSAHPGVWAKDMHAQRPDLSMADLQTTLKTLAGRWCVNGCLNTGHLTDTMKFLQKSDSDLKGLKAIPESEMANRTFVKAAVSSLGAAKGSVDTA